MNTFKLFGTFEPVTALFSSRYAVFIHERYEANAGLTNLRLCTNDKAATSLLARSSDVCYIADLHTGHVDCYTEGQPTEPAVVGDTAFGRAEGLALPDLTQPFWLFLSHRYEEVDGLRDLYGTYQSIEAAELALKGLGLPTEQVRLYDLREGLIYSD